MKDKFFTLFSRLCSVETVGGCKREGAEKIANICREETDFFENVYAYADGSVLLVHKCGDENAKTLLVDAHIDTVGFIVKEVLDGGFLSVLAVGGIDKRILPSSRVEIYGKRTIYGVFASTPPHLKSQGEFEYPDFNQIYIDTGLCKEELLELCPAGTLCGFLSESVSLNGSIMSKHLDDKICAASALFCTNFLKNKNIGANLALCFSSGEESACVGIFNRLYKDGFLPEGALVLDVNFAKEQGVRDFECHTYGAGVGISYSASTDRNFTDAVLECARRNEIPVQTVVEAQNTGTNAHALQIVAHGVPTCVASVPIRHMHAPCEVASIEDALSLSRLIAQVAEEFPKFCPRKRYIKKGVE